MTLCLLHKRLDGPARFAQADHPDQAAAIADRRGHIHHRGGWVLRVRAGGARSVAPLQGQVHIVPAGKVLAFIFSSGVEQHHTGGTGDVDMGMNAIFFQTPDIRIRGTAGVTIERLAQGRGNHDLAVSGILGNDFRQQVGRVHQGFFGGLAHQRLGLAEHQVQHEPAHQPENQEVEHQ